jgi:hypothetical protein
LCTRLLASFPPNPAPPSTTPPTARVVGIEREKGTFHQVYKNDEKSSRQLIFPAGGPGAEDEEEENLRVLEVRSECSSPGDLDEAQKAVNGVKNEIGKVHEKCHATGIFKLYECTLAVTTATFLTLLARS